MAYTEETLNLKEHENEPRYDIDEEPLLRGPEWSTTGAIGYIRLKIQQFRSFSLVGWIPLILFLVLGAISEVSVPVRFTVLLALSLLLFCLAAVSLRPWERFPMILDVGGLICWVVLTIVAWVKKNDSTFEGELKLCSGVIVLGCFALIVSVSLLIDRPFTLDYAVLSLPRHIWKDPKAQVGIRYSCYVVALMWFTCFIVMSVSEAIVALLIMLGVLKANTLGKVVVIILKYVIPYGMLFGTVIAQQIWIRYSRNKREQMETLQLQNEYA